MAEAEFSMATPNWRTVIPFIFLVNILAHTANGLLVGKPHDTFALLGKVAALNCSTSLADDVHWYHGTIHVYAGGNVYDPYRESVKVEVYHKNNSTSYNLVFLSAKPTDAGMYSCLDNQGRGETSQAEMTVFTADENGACQSNMRPDGVVIPNDCNIDPDEVQLSCSVTFYGKNPPQLEWKKVPDNGNSAPTTECQSINNRVICNTSITGDQQMNRSSYVCQTAESSHLTTKLCTIDVKTLIYAFSSRTTTKSSVGNEVQCNPNTTSQSCHYTWKYSGSGSVFSKSRSMTPNETGLYQCEAKCNIRDKRCIVFDYVYIDQSDDWTSCSTGSVVGICLAILLPIVLIITVISCYLIRKEKRKNQRLPNQSSNEPEFGMNSQENGTQEERTGFLRRRDKEVEKNNREPNLIQTLQPEAVSKGHKAVFGLTILGDELFVAIMGWPVIEVFGDLQKLEPIRKFSLKGHELEILWDMQSSSMHGCLYIADKKKDEEKPADIIKIDPEGNVQTSWSAGCEACRLSVTSEFNVIATSLYDGKIREYSANGRLIRLIELPQIADGPIVHPWVTLKRSNDEYIISYGNHGDSQHRVCAIDKNGKIKQYIGGKKGSSNDQFNVPVHLAVYPSGHVLVVDKDNSRVVLLSPELKFIKALITQDGCLRFPNRICLDEKNKRLFVSDNNWISNMKPWNDGRVLVFDMSSVQTGLNTVACLRIDALGALLGPPNFEGPPIMEKKNF